MSNFYTKNGDSGESGLLGEGRFPKSDLRFEVLGSLDEASAVLGVARSYCEDTNIREILLSVQKDLYNLMAEVGATPENAHLFRKIGDDQVHSLEANIEQLTDITGTPREFIIPGEIRSSAFFSLARAIVRRAERRLVELNQTTKATNPSLLRYLNRLSSLCFAMELFENFTHGVKTRSIKDL